MTNTNLTQGMSEQFRPCPFCGCEDLSFVDMTYMHATGPTKGKRVKCQTCGAQATDAAWNTRVPTSQPGSSCAEAVESGEAEYPSGELVAQWYAEWRNINPDVSGNWEPWSIRKAIDWALQSRPAPLDAEVQGQAQTEWLDIPKFLRKNND